MSDPVVLRPGGRVQLVPPRTPRFVARPPGPGRTVVMPVPGLPGPRGPAGDGGITHIQSTPAATWTIDHPLGRWPAGVMVVIAGQLVDTDIEFPSITQIVISFASPQSGRAEII